ncbi:MAG TPA: BON domain-containing protein [Nevskia sp.]|nr:BON domain-containing protein [Nevskia sp.]
MKIPKIFRTTLVAAGLGAGLCGGAALSAAAYADDATPHSDGIGAAITDTAITAKVKARLLEDSRLKKSHVSVTTTNGAVTLTGTAPSSDAAAAAKELASGVDGVKSVDDQVNTPSLADTVAAKTDKAAQKTGKYASDSWITTKVKSDLLSDSVTKGLNISVKTSNGVVALSGTVADSGTVDHVKDLAAKVRGVKSVDTSALKTSGG